jgi:hypothetical protein
MIHFISENMAPLMFGGMILFMLIGFPAENFGVTRTIGCLIRIIDTQARK